MSFQGKDVNIFKKMRLDSGQSQQELAKKLGICQTQISRVENGKQLPSIVLATFIVRSCGNDLGEVGEYFVTREGSYSQFLQRKDRAD